MLEASTCGCSSNALLERLGPGLGVGVVQQVLGQLGQHRVERLPGVVTRLGPDVGDPAHQLHVDARHDRVV
jgi:hypothetical protein